MARSLQSKQKQSFFLTDGKKQVLIDWFAGLAAGFLSVSACAPLELARTRLIIVGETNAKRCLNYGGLWRTLGSVYQSEGVRGLYRGYNVTALVITMSHSCYFALYNHTKNEMKKARVFHQDLSVNCLAATLAGLVCDFATNPLWVVRTRLQAQYVHDLACSKTTRYTSLFNGLKTMYHEEGLLSLWKGFGASIYGLSHVAVLFPLYERLKLWRKEAVKRDLDNFDIILCSSISKVCAMILTYPQVVIRARLQDDRTPWKGEAPTEIIKKNSFLGTAGKIIRKEGFRALYSGLKVDMVRVLPTNAITFTVFEQTKSFLQKRYMH